MTLLLTGATGFVGNALLCKFRAIGFDRENRVVCLSSREIEGWECVNHRGWRFSKDDLLAAGIGNLDVVVHCGATTPHASEDFSPDRAARFAMNVRNTCWLHENLPSCPKKIVFVSTTDVYGNASGRVDEDTPVAPASMYGASKLMCEKYLQECSRSEGFALDVLRLGPLYGEGEETYSKIVSSFVAKIDAGEPICLRGTGEETRSLLHVDDCCACMVRAISAAESMPVVNVASGNAVSIRRIIDIISDEMGKRPCISEVGGTMGRSDSFDTALARRLFGDYERPLEDGIRSYVRYYRQGGGRAHV